MEKNLKFPNLFKPLQVNGYTYKNRIVSAPMVFGLIVGDPHAAVGAYNKIGARAKGGAAAVIVGETDINFTDGNRVPVPPCDFNVHSGHMFDAVAKYATIIKENGAVAIAEISHPGAEKNPYPGQKNPVGPVAYTKENGVQVDAMDEEDMNRLCREFAESAGFMIAAGFDGIIVHAGHGFLFTQFLSSRLNLRQDEYGGSLENRMRFPIRIMESIRKEIGPDKILDIRVSAEEATKDGITVEETGKFAHMLEGIVDSIHVSSGLYTDPVRTEQFSSMFAEHGCHADAAAEIKKHTNLPVGVIGGINSPELAEEIIASGKADYVILGRQMIADPEFPNKAMSGNEDKIRRCIRCYTCFPGSPEEGYTDLPMTTEELIATVGYCAINPASSRKEFEKAKVGRKVLVVGGGVAGMQAAITASERGHQVVLVEKAGQLGGILNFTDVDVDKPDLREFKNLMIRETMNHGIEVMLHTEATAELIGKLEPDTIIIATGSYPSKPNIPGIDTVHQAIDIYNGYETGEKVIMIGGGLVGCEAALHLAKTGHQVVVVEMLDKLAKESYGMYREALMLEMEKAGIQSHCDTCCLQITPTSVLVSDKDGKEIVLEADSVIYALGMKAIDNSSLKEIAGSIPVYEIGDCVVPAKVDSATKSAYFTAIEIN
jgi:2,4-dienoyl-CoA reductase-like NADH-dependent reductase (Old Yellow Enzyme family)/thioredoxin reductase